jgi:hypothetical protein
LNLPHSVTVDVPMTGRPEPTTQGVVVAGVEP